ENPALWWLINYKDSRWAGFGIDEELKRRGLYDPDRVAIRETVVPAPPETPALPAIAAIASLQGNRARGEQAARACLMCHRIDGALTRRGCYDPDRVASREGVVPAPPDTSALPAIAAIARRQGNRERGEQAARGCLMCRRSDGAGVDCGPGIEGFASRQTKE